MTKNKFDLAARLAKVFPDVKFTVMLSAAGERIVERLDDAWIESALRPILLLNDRVEVMLSTRSEEPMVNAMNFAKPFEHVYEDGLEVGTITAQRRTDVPLVRVMVVVPTLDLIEHPSNFKIELHSSKLASLVAKTYTRAYHMVPLTLDVYRQHRNTRGKGRATQRPPAMVRSGEPGGDLNSKTMWIAMHWAESGGAESWAWEQARIAREAGFTLVFTFDRCAPQRQLHLASQMSDFVYLIDHGVSGQRWPALVAEIMDAHRPGFIHIHHSKFVYAMLPLIRSLYPDVHVEDSTHIAEHRGGGFVSDTIGNKEFLDLHHVISPQLQRLLDEGGVLRSKVVFRPLTSFTSDQASPKPVELPVNRPIRLGFLGRLSAQKRPVLFLALAAFLNKRYPGRFEFIMQGSGELEAVVQQQMKRLRLNGVVQRRGWGPTSDFFEDVDVLVITSENEGLTLTTIEADAAGVLVVSTNVGSQETVIAPGALLPREPIPFFKSANALFDRLSSDPKFVSDLAREQRKRLDFLHDLESASDFFKRHYEQIMAETSAKERE
ncbi:MAG: glycosyltransferase [Actinomycetaceae bacterium]|nr:glycosyltransferase [Actinomycetaceae bacterium]